ncbi:hypothetical protein [Actinocrispum wychmicini]|uniref:Uncharacterized protein n=1 Tax=Actinocrispum wychmicini TaxID=1213861 RepID=A0A4R2JC10_9PSEU|nr:hypothetical protein [Actinocrispum wychmicini]TCO54316.1 hypothetical protein EV192_109297 [Actinocrispum wychmicini]
MRALLFDDNQQFWFETLRVLGHATYGGSHPATTTVGTMPGWPPPSGSRPRRPTGMPPDRLTAPKTFLRFTSAEGAGAHCHSGAQRLAMSRIYDWLDDNLRK